MRLLVCARSCVQNFIYLLLLKRELQYAAPGEYEERTHDLSTQSFTTRPFAVKNF